MNQRAVHLPIVSEESSTERSSEEQSQWGWQARNAITDLANLEKAFTLTDSEREGARRALADGFPLSITPYYASLADRDDPNCAIRKQCVPVVGESLEVEGDLRDPLGEEDHVVAKHLVQRYPDRVLFLVTDRCSVYCRFCTRSRMVGQGGGARPRAELEEAFSYIENHPEVRDVIISGGDPLMMGNDRLAFILDRLATIDHIDTVRMATRTPVTLPQRIDHELAQVLRRHPSLWVMTHFNHPKEVTEESMRACKVLVDAGIPIMNQSVLLRGINDDAQVLTELFRKLVRNRVRPYYLLHADPVRGTGHLRTTLDESMAIVTALQGRLSGIALPKFIVDTAGGMGKVPLAPEAIVKREPGRTTLRTFRDVEVVLVDPPR